MASPRQAAKREAIDGLMCTLLDTFRPKEEPDGGGEPEFRRAAFVPMKVSPEDLAANDLLYDMSNWERLDRNVRKELNLEPDPKKLELALKAFLSTRRTATPSRSRSSARRRSFLSVASSR